jgi:hypothetical protein
MHREQTAILYVDALQSRCLVVGTEAGLVVDESGKAVAMI